MSQVTSRPRVPCSSRVTAWYAYLPISAWSGSSGHRKPDHIREGQHTKRRKGRSIAPVFCRFACGSSSEGADLRICLSAAARRLLVLSCILQNQDQERSLALDRPAKLAAGPTTVFGLVNSTCRGCCCSPKPAGDLLSPG